MVKKYLLRSLILVLLFITQQVLAQPCSGPGRTPQTATVVCGTLVFSQPVVTSCTGPSLPAAGCTDLLPSTNSIWYRFHCYQSGTLGFLLTPILASDDYDWEVLDITGHAPQDALITNLAISVNFSGISGPTGCTSAGLLDLRCAGGANGTQFNRMPAITVGHDYLLVVNNFSNTGQGYNLSFSGGTAVLSDNQLPTVTAVGPVGCNTSQIKVQFSEDILCSSVTPTGSEFVITDGTNTFPFTGFSSQCSGGLNAITELTFNMQNPLPPGNYSLVVNTGTDGNTLLDVCLTELIPGTMYPITITAQPALAITGITHTGCAPVKLKVAFNKPVLCNSITASGSEFSISPGNPAITSVQTNCGGANTYTDTIEIQLQNPLPHGNYQLIVNNGTDTNTFLDTCAIPLAAGYNFPFTILQTSVAPAIQSIHFDECKPFRVIVNFDKPVDCNSISATGSEFSVTPGALTISSIQTNCIAGFTSRVILDLSGNLPAGNFRVNINTGADGNTISDSCFAFTPAMAVFPFTTTQAPAPAYDSLQFDKCSPSSIKVFYSKPLLCSSIQADGSEFSITGPATVQVNSVTTDATCSNGYTRWVLLNLSQPINTLGTFTLHNMVGADGNSVLDTCYAAQLTNETISFNVLGSPSANFRDSVHFGCINDTLVLSHPGGNGINFYQWTFSDGTVFNGPSVSHIFPVFTATASVQLIVSNAVCADTLSRSYTLNNGFAVGFHMNTDTVCRQKAIQFTNTSSGNALTYSWDFGDGNIFNGDTAPPHPYLLPGNYAITLTATNNHHCSSDSILIVHVTDTPVVRFTGLNTQYCTGESILLQTNISSLNITGYVWNNGNGLQSNNQTPFRFGYASQGNYTVSLTAADRFCGDFSYSLPVQIYQVPVFSLGDDITLCPGMSVNIGVTSAIGYTYLWNTGALTPVIPTGPASGTYILTADNHSCTATDEMYVNVLDNCLIKVPSAFTPNGDGVNDLLKAINADLATQFTLKVYNRFGEMMYLTHIPTRGWDGRYKGQEADAGTYVWMLDYIHPVSQKHVFEKGTSVLLR